MEENSSYLCKLTYNNLYSCAVIFVANSVAFFNGCGRFLALEQEDAPPIIFSPAKLRLYCLSQLGIVLSHFPNLYNSRH